MKTIKQTTETTFFQPTLADALKMLPLMNYLMRSKNNCDLYDKFNKLSEEEKSNYYCVYNSSPFNADELDNMIEVLQTMGFESVHVYQNDLEEKM